MKHGYLLTSLFLFFGWALYSVRPIATAGNADPQADYENYCSGCHGVQMEAFVDRQWKYGKSRDDLFRSIKVGYPDDGMPSYDTTFSDPEIYALVDYIQKGIEARAAYDFTEESVAGQVYTHGGRSYRLEVITTGVAIPWGLAFLPDGDMLITNRDGELYRLTTDRDLVEISGVPRVHARGQGGLLDVELHPAFAENGLVYLSYSKPGSGGRSTTAIYRARLVGNTLREGADIFVAEPYETTRHHYGSRMEFGPEGYLYFSVGDRGRRDKNPQALDNHAGKVHRIRDDGSIPEDNPFVDQPGAMPSIYSYGHRNIQGLTREPGTNKIWTHEHGPRGGDEINIVEPGKNYGWPVISYGINYNGTTFTDQTAAPGLEQPLHYWVPSIAPCGADFVTGDRYPDWRGDLVVGSLRFEYLNLCEVADGQVVGEEKLLPNIGRLRNVRMGPDDYLYVATEQPGRIIRVVPQ
jgi:glucose/arabinose dehydrogenase